MRDWQGFFSTYTKARKAIDKTIVELEWIKGYKSSDLIISKNDSYDGNVVFILKNKPTSSRNLEFIIRGRVFDSKVDGLTEYSQFF